MPEYWFIRIAQGALNLCSVELKISKRIANSVGTDETDCYKQSHLDLHCSQRYLMKGLTG